jgi:mono/diheme cytochrome c family protein
MKRSIFIATLFLTSCLGGPNKSDKQSDKQSNITNTQADMIADGRSLFMQKCATCHAVNVALTGPALKGVTARWSDKQLLYSFIHNSQKVIAEDAYSKDLYNKWNKVQMTSFESLTDKNIEAILAYIEAEQ